MKPQASTHSKVCGVHGRGSAPRTQKAYARVQQGALQNESFRLKQKNVIGRLYPQIVSDILPIPKMLGACTLMPDRLIGSAP